MSDSTRNTHHAPDTQDAGWRFAHSYTQLSDVFYARSRPVPFSKPSLYILNRQLALELGLNFDRFPEAELASLFAGQQIPNGADPIAQA